MQKFTLYNPVKYVFGVGTFSQMKSVLKPMGKYAAILIGGDSVVKNGYLETLTDQLESLDRRYTVCKGIEPNPRTTTIDRIREAMAEDPPDLIIGLGGGSVMDAAKAVSISLDDISHSIWDYVYLGDPSIMRRPEKKIPTLLIPTLAATGSEFDPISVITNWEEHLKAAMFSELMFPNVSVVDPTLTYSAGGELTACGGVDIITHITESYFLTQEHNPIQDGFTEILVKNIMAAVPACIKDPEDEQARSILSYASSLALSGFINAGRNRNFVMHAIEHSLSAHLDIAHGLGLALIMPSYLRYISPFNEDKLIRFFENVMGVDVDTPREKSIEEGIRLFEKWIGDIGISGGLSAYGAKREMIPAYAEDVLRLKGGKGKTLYVNEKLDAIGISEILCNSL
ncbi:iron-containing alcohol dehydrogenase [bacterium]|nr:iron-containing alcohol dehydrogenase [bacterium]